MSFDLLCEKITAKKNPTVVGLDVTLDMIPPSILTRAYSHFGETLEGASEAILQYNRKLIDAIADIVPAVKPQIAFYEQFGWQGMRTFALTIDYAKRKGLYVIADIKRGDIGSTASAYAAAFLGRTEVEGHKFTAFPADSVTVNGYLGSDSIQPFTRFCVENKKSAFLLIKTSNPSSGEIQDQLLKDGRKVYEMIADYLNEWNAPRVGKCGFGHLGAVVGATYPAQQAELRQRLPSAFFLVPGYGAQGATAEDIVPSFREDGLGSIVNSSRGILNAYSKFEMNHENFADAARSASVAMRNDIVGAIRLKYPETIFS